MSGGFARFAAVAGLILSAGGAIAGAAEGAAAGKVVFDFERGDLHGFKVVEGSATGIVTTKQDIVNLQGSHVLTTLFHKQGKSDGYREVIESPVFVLAGPQVSFLVGGGSSPNTYVAVCTVDGKIVLKARGQNSTTMRRITWDAARFVGKKLFVRIFDGRRGGWGHVTFDDFKAAGAVDLKATAEYRAKRKAVLPKGPTGPTARAKQGRRPAPPAVPPGGNAKSLRDAINDLIASFAARYPKGREFCKKLDAVEAGLKAGDAKARAAFAALQREALIANPLVSGQPILFNSRPQFAGDHHNTATMFQYGEINGNKMRGPGFLKIIDFANGGKVTTILEAGAKGVIRDPEVSFDGKRIVFSMRRETKDCYHIYEVSAGGAGLKQLTFADGITDIDPLYLAGGSIVFTSTREPKFCMCNRHIMGNLFKMEADGANIHQIGKSTLHEGHSTLMPDGRILYDRWEYVDRNFGDAQGLWTVNPDGTNHAIYWANNTASPGAVLDGRIIPGTKLVVCTFSSCHDLPWGAIAIVDRRLGVDGREPVVRTWPAGAINLVGRGGLDTFKRVRPKYEDPWPLADPAVATSTGKYFLASRNGRDMVLLDVFGNEIVLHSESPGVFDPMPLAPRPRPAAKPAQRDFNNATGVFYLQNAYIGTHMKGIKPGAIKYLRIIESPEKKSWTHPSWGGEGVHCPGLNWHSFENKRILGTVPVEADGSANFEVPSDTFLYFQLLDSDGMMIQSMRSGTIIQSGERQGCVGCHEDRVEDTPPLTRLPLALKRAANKMNGWYGRPRIFSFQKEVQPVFDKHCLKCHDFGKKGAKKLVLAGDRTICFNASYIDLWSKRYIRAIGAGPAAIQQAYSWGSHPSKIVQVLRKGHNKVKLSTEDLDRIVTWIDINATYYPYYESAYPNNPTGRCPLDNGQYRRLGQLTRARFVTGHGRNRSAAVSFDRPEMSPCLQKLDKSSAAYKEALAIIQAGKAMLAKRPRADMDGFVPCEWHRKVLAKYQRRREIELANRKAIREGKKLYDAKPQ